LRVVSRLSEGPFPRERFRSRAAAASGRPSGPCGPVHSADGRSGAKRFAVRTMSRRICGCIPGGGPGSGGPHARRRIVREANMSVPDPPSGGRRRTLAVGFGPAGQTRGRNRAFPRERSFRQTAHRASAGWAATDSRPPPPPAPRRPARPARRRPATRRPARTAGPRIRRRSPEGHRVARSRRIARRSAGSALRASR